MAQSDGFERYEPGNNDFVISLTLSCIQYKDPTYSSAPSIQSVKVLWYVQLYETIFYLSYSFRSRDQELGLNSGFSWSTSVNRSLASVDRDRGMFIRSITLEGHEGTYQSSSGYPIGLLCPSTSITMPRGAKIELATFWKMSPA